MNPERRYQVFMSSTFRDLIEERQAALQAVLELDHMPAGMELFPATDDSTWQLIKDVIDASDYYVVIVGGGDTDQLGPTVLSDFWTARMNSSSKSALTCRVERRGNSRRSTATAFLERFPRRSDRSRTPMVAWIRMSRPRAASRAAASSVSRIAPGCSTATRNASTSPSWSSRTRASTRSAAGVGPRAVTWRQENPGRRNASGRWRAISRRTTAGRSRRRKSCRRSRHPSSSRWMTGPASHTTDGGTVSVVSMKSPLDVLLHEGFGQLGRM